MGRTAAIKRLPKAVETLNLSKQQMEITKLIVEQNMTVHEVAITLGVKRATVYKQLDRIEQKVIEQKENVDKKDSGGDYQNSPGVNYLQNPTQKLPSKKELEKHFSTQVARIQYLKTIGCTKKQISSVLGISHFTVKNALRKARTQNSKRFVLSNEELQKYRPTSESQREFQVRLDSGRFFFNRFVTGANQTSEREVLHCLAIVQMGGYKGRKILLKERGRMLKLLAEQSRGTILSLDGADNDTQQTLKPVLRDFFTQVTPGHYKPAKEGAWQAVREALYYKNVEISVLEAASDD